MTADLLTLIAHHATLASVPHPLPSPAVTELDVIRPLRRQAQRRFDTSPVWARGLGAAA